MGLVNRVWVVANFSSKSFFLFSFDEDGLYTVIGVLCRQDFDNKPSPFFTGLQESFENPVFVSIENFFKNELEQTDK